MKKRIVSFLAASLLLFSVGVASADDGGVNVSIGYKAWLNEWQTSYTFNSTADGKHVLSMTSDAELSSIPVLAVKYKDIFLSGSYYAKTEFSFVRNTYRTLDTSNNDFIENLDVTAERKEWDATFGYYIHPSVAITAGYKNISQLYTAKYSATGYTYPNGGIDKSETKITGPTLGMTGSAPIGGGFGLYGSFAYGWLKSEFEGSSKKEDSNYVLSEFGFNHKAANMPLVISAGYRYQAIDTKNSTMGDHIAPDVTKGFVFGVNFIF